VLTKTFITIGIFLSLFSYAYADYEVFDLNPVPTNQPIANVNEWQMVGFSSGPTFIEYNTDATVTQFDRITIPFCRNGGANGGSIWLEVRSTATSGPIVASSTLTVNSNNVWNTGCTSAIINATTSTFVLNQNVQWLEGGTFYFIFRAIGTTGTFYLSFDVDDGNNGKYLGAGATPPTWLGDYYWTSVQGYALGIPPVVYNASSSNVVCDTFDFGCYLSQSFAWAFYPDKEVIDQFKTLSLASTTPFGYAYAIPTLWNTFMVANAATTSTFGLTIDFSTLTGAGFQYVTATSVEVFNVCWVNDSRGELPQNAFRDLFLPYIRAFIWIALGFGLFLLAHKLW